MSKIRDIKSKDKLVTCEWCARSKSANPTSKICQGCYIAQKEGKIVREYVRRILKRDDREIILTLLYFRTYREGFFTDINNTELEPVEFIRKKYKEIT